MRATLQVAFVVWLGAMLACVGERALGPKSDRLIALRVADELERERAFDPARRQLEAIADTVAAENRAAHKTAPGSESGPADESAVESADSIRLRICAMWEREQEMERARACYARMAEQLGSNEVRALARYRLASLAAAGGDRAAAIEQLLLIVDTFPETDAAHRAVRLARGFRRKSGGAVAEADFLLGLASQLRSRASEPEAPVKVRSLFAGALVEAGRIRFEARGNRESALRLLGRAKAAAAGTVWLDDAMIWRARVLRASERRELAIAEYQELIDARETSWFVGSYDSPHLDDAFFELAETLVELGRLEEARDAYLDLVDENPESRLVDDAVFRAARLAAQTGDVDPLEDFVDDYPDSRHVDAAKELLKRHEEGR